MNCPKCLSEILNEITIEGTTVDQCRSCKGIWFDEQELSQLLADDASQVASLRRGAENDLADIKRGRCPRDNSDLLRVYSSIDRSVTLDVCPDCHGIWVDGGEFEKLFAARPR
jgi:rhomboid family protein